VGFYATPGNTLGVHGVLWFDTTTPIAATGADVTQSFEHTGDPSFAQDGYHLRTDGSAALNRGLTTGVDRDVDGELRPIAGFPELGADEVMPMAPITPAAGGSVSFVDPQGRGEMTVTIPPDAVSAAIELLLVPFPPLPGEITDALPPGSTPFGLPFRLDGILNGVPITTLPLSVPMTVSLQTSQAPPLATDTELLATWQQMFGGLGGIGGLGGLSSLMFGPGGLGPPTRPAADVIEAAIGIIGDPPAPPPPVAQRLTVQGLAADPEYDFLYYFFVAEIEQHHAYLPVIMR
jgi:hypothetical protein